MNIETEMSYLSRQFFKKEFWDFTKITKQYIEIFLINTHISDPCLNLLFKNVCDMYHTDFVISILELKKNQLNQESFYKALKYAIDSQNSDLFNVISNSALTLLFKK